jgi:hypothetical protein
MPRPKGLPKTGGRKKGVPNKMTKEAREAALIFINGVSPKELRACWDRAMKDDANAALRVYYTALEFVAPKLQRRELTGPDGAAQAVEVRHVTLTYPVLGGEPTKPEP